MSAPHTTGPWHAGGDGTIIYAKDGFATASASIFHGRHGGRDEAKANARLIAAAPELLEALQACDEAMDYMSEYDIPLTLPAQIKAAIAKAVGAA